MRIARFLLESDLHKLTLLHILGFINIATVDFKLLKYSYVVTVVTICVFIASNRRKRVL